MCYLTQIIRSTPAAVVGRRSLPFGYWLYCCLFPGNSVSCRVVGAAKYLVGGDGAAKDDVLSSHGWMCGWLMKKVGEEGVR